MFILLLHSKTNGDLLVPTPTLHKPAPQPRIPVVLIVVAVLLVVALLLAPFIGRTPTSETPASGEVSSAGSDGAIARAFQNQQSGVQVTGAGFVTRILGDDNDGGQIGRAHV